MITYSQKSSLVDQNIRNMIRKSNYSQPVSDKGKPEIGEENKSPSPSRGRGVGERERKDQLLKYAKTLRSNQTDAEQRLWYHLRARRFMGLKFKRQKPIGPFIADFVCLEHKLVVEADGGQHGGADDQRRDEWFAAHGFTVLRFWNHEILGETEAVLERIREAVLLPSPPTPLPLKGEGSENEKPISPYGERDWGEGRLDKGKKT